jgi:DNA-binding beta-propeller fold protein YncE
MKLSVATALLLAAVGCSDDETCDPSVVGNICTIAGNGDNGYDRDADSKAIPALEARMSLPQDTLTAPDGTLYILDWNNHRLRSVGDDGMLRWVAGRGELGGSLDDPANGDFNHPTNMIFDPTGTRVILAAWHNSKIREVDLATGTVVDTCGNGARAYFGDEGDALTASLDLPAAVAWDPQGDLVVMDQANQVLRRIDSTGVIHRLAGQCIVDQTTQCADGQTPQPCPDRADGRPSGKYTCGDPAETCVGGPLGACNPSYGGDEGPATELRMSQPFGQSAAPAGRIAYDDAGNLYFADTGNNLIRMIDTSGIVHRIAGKPPVDGVPQAGYSGDGGAATDALLNFPVDLAIAGDGTVYFSDVLNHCIRAIDPGGTIRTVVGQCGVEGYEGDGGPAAQATLLRPFGIELIGSRLNISDTGNSVIRTVLLEGE